MSTVYIRISDRQPGEMHQIPESRRGANEKSHPEAIWDRRRTITRLLTKEEKEFSARKVLISWRLLSAGREALLRARCYSDLHTRRTVHTADVILSLAYHTLVLARYSRGVYSELFTGDLALYTMARKNSYTQNIVYGEYKIKVQKQCQWL